MHERFDLKKLARTALLATAVAGCASPNVTKSPDQTINPLPTPSATEIVLPTQSTQETPKPTEMELSLEQQASNYVFDYWSNLLDSTQSVEDGVDKYYLKNQVYNPSDWQPNVEVIKHGGAQNSDLKVVWVGGEVYPEQTGSTKYLGIKSQGGMTIRGINFSAEPRQLTNGDKSAGISWDGNIVLRYQVSWAENEFWPSDNNSSSDLSTLRSWITNWEQDPYWESSPFEEAQYVTSLVYQNGKWIMGQSDFSANSKIGDPLSGVIKPMPWMGDPDVCQNPNISSSCQLIKKTINY